MNDLTAVVLLVITFAGVLFLLLNGNHWLIVSAQIFLAGLFLMLNGPLRVITLES